LRHTVSKYDNFAQVVSLLLLYCKSVDNLGVICATGQYVGVCLCESFWACHTCV